MNKTGMQAAFDTATSAIILQGKRSVSIDGTCQYRGPNGLKCAIGHLMTDSQIHAYGIMNSEGAHVFTSLLVKELVPDVTSHDEVETVRDFLAALQDAHDNSYASSYTSIDTWKGFVADFTERANTVAIEYGLTPIKSMDFQ